MAAPPRRARTPRAAAQHDSALHAALEAAGIGIWEWDLRGGAVRWSPAAETLLGPSRACFDDLDSYLALVCADDRQRLREALAGAAQGHDFALEVRFQPPGGAERWISHRGQIERDGRGRPRRVICFVQDLTAEKQAEAAQRWRERHYRELFENSNDILYTLDLEGNVTELNREHERVTGYTAAELLGRPISDIVLPEYRQRMQQMRARKLDGEPVTTYELGVRARDGRSVILEVSSRLLYDGDRLVGLQGSARDITARKQAAEALRRSEERLQRIVENAAVGIHIFDRGGGSLLLNAAVEEIFGVSREQWEGGSAVPPFRLLRPDGAPLPTRAHPFALVRRTGGPLHGMEFVVVRPTGQRVVVSASGAALHDAAGRFDGVVLVYHDVTERERAERQLRDAVAVRDQFLSIASHELRTPLTSLKGQIQLGQRRLQRGAQPEEIAASLTIAEQQVNRLARLVGELLDVSRLASGRFGIVPVPLALDPLVRRVVETERAAEPPHPIDFGGAGGAPEVRADPDRLEQVLVNLLQNARKYSPPGSPIRVRVWKEPEAVAIAVQDRGIGVPPADQERIFQPFQRASNVDRGVAGLGLGLYIAAEIARAHGGAIDLDSLPGEGSTFTLRLPLGEGGESGD
ncbi:MAG TPA: PAS domain S-box protein [Dehalococcoidia bacterium]|nr:PAS domain S-box protein [Dehalococcoidia bacterium]